MAHELKRRKETRLTPLGRFMISLFFIVLTAIIGALIGYSIIGQGDPIEVFKADTWIQLYDVVVNSLF
ncbi:DNA-directed RNA polymerase subunit beta [Domibacillus sp. A3M-37]|uniref:DNA-directed RNA polymerase subunit beta n=1 Tax=Domibacillus TaxID=1433999 RepID=UPI00061822A8|nr:MULTISPECIES: DNA-directed RNA polymerase subunit beta [Domibacillus]MCP3761457.1 DNA-directed RNA polymerase subunit beta [Domibacillus sp. A3M-37]